RGGQARGGEAAHLVGPPLACARSGRAAARRAREEGSCAPASGGARRGGVAMSADRRDRENEGQPLTRLVDEPGEWSSLASHVEAAESTQKRARLHPGAVDRIEARLEMLEVSGRSPWRVLRAPAYVGAALAVALLAWSRFRPEPTSAA